MESLRKQVLQAELTRIENEAEAQSFSIMNKADALLTAHVLCQKINEHMKTSFFKVDTIYYSTGCSIVIFTHENGNLFLRGCADHGLEITDEGKFGTTSLKMSVAGFPGVEVVVEQKLLADYLRADYERAA